MSNDMEWQFISNLSGKYSEPCLTSSVSQRLGVLKINVCAVELIVFDVLHKRISTFDRI